MVLSYLQAETAAGRQPYSIFDLLAGLGTSLRQFLSWHHLARVGARELRVTIPPQPSFDITSPEVAWLTVTPQRRSIKLMASPISLQVCRSEGTYLPGRRVPAVLTRERGPRRPPPECPPS